MEHRVVISAIVAICLVITGVAMSGRAANAVVPGKKVDPVVVEQDDVSAVLVPEEGIPNALGRSPVRPLKPTRRSRLRLVR